MCIWFPAGEGSSARGCRVMPPCTLGGVFMRRITIALFFAVGVIGLAPESADAQILPWRRDPCGGRRGLFGGRLLGGGGYGGGYAGDVGGYYGGYAGAPGFDGGIGAGIAAPGIGAGAYGPAGYGGVGVGGYGTGYGAGYGAMPGGPGANVGVGV